MVCFFFFPLQSLLFPCNFYCVVTYGFLNPALPRFHYAVVYIINVSDINKVNHFLVKPLGLIKNAVLYTVMHLLCLSL